MKKWMALAVPAVATLALLAGNSLAHAAGDPPQIQLQDRTCTQTCDPAQDCEGNQIQQRPRTRQDWPDEGDWGPQDEAELELLLWLLGLD